jgi:DNA-directed RNA polymerase subunit M/transcription elongation factor TFIIS
MKFCECCNNMLYVTTNENRKLVYYCKSCGFKDVDTTSGSICIIDDNKVNDKTKYSQYINKYLKHDPCLPRVNNIVCPSAECTKPDGKDNEVIYLKYDHTNMKYIYHCCHCDNFWTA